MARPKNTKRSAVRKRATTPVRGRAVVMTRAQLEADADRIAHDLLGVDRIKAFKKLDRGELSGTLAEMYLSPVRELLD